MTSTNVNATGSFSAGLDAILADNEQAGRDLGRRSEERATRASADVATATARFRKLAERVQQGAQERADPKPKQQELAPDDPLAELEAMAADITETPPDPDEPSEAEVNDILDTMKPLAPPESGAAQGPDTSALQWNATTSPRSGELSDDDFEFPW